MAWSQSVRVVAKVKHKTHNLEFGLKHGTGLDRLDDALLYK